MCLCLFDRSICLSAASRISETSEAIAIKSDTVTASVTKRHHGLIISVTDILVMKITNVRLFQKPFIAMPVTIAVKIVRVEV